MPGFLPFTRECPQFCGRQRKARTTMGDLLPSRRIRLLTVLSSVAAAQVSFAATITQFPSLPVQNSSFAIEDLDGDRKFDIILISATPNTGGVPVICEVIG